MGESKNKNIHLDLSLCLFTFEMEGIQDIVLSDLVYFLAAS